MISPTCTFQSEVQLEPEEQSQDLLISVKDNKGRLLVSFQ